MSLSKLIQDAVTNAMPVLDDLAGSFTYSTVGQYDPATGQVAAGSSATIKNVVLVGYSAAEASDLILSTDRKAIIAKSTLAGTVLDTKGSITGPDGVIYEIKAISQDPAGATVILQLRQ